MLVLAASLLLCTPTRLALVIGVNRSDVTARQPLRYADDDAIAMHQLFGDLGVSSVLLTTPDTDSAPLYSVSIDGPATSAQLRSSVQALQERVAAERAAGRDAELYVFFSGHGGVQDGEGYVTLDDRRLTRTELYEDILAAVGATRNHVMIDACRSYFMVFDKGERGERQRYMGEMLGPRTPALTARVGVIVSTAADQDSHEWERFGAGVFSYELRSALRGGADLDGDGVITYAEVGGFLQTANAAVLGRHRPSFFMRAPGVNLEPNALATWPADAERLRLERWREGRTFAENTMGVRIFDVHPPRDRSLTLYTPHARPLILRTEPAGKELLLTRQGSATLSAMPVMTATHARKGSEHFAFEALFARPFDVDAVSDFTQTYATLQAPRVATSPSSTRRAWRYALFASALAVTAAGGATSFAAWRMQAGAQNASQSARFAANEQIATANVAAVTCYVSGALLGAFAAWLWSTP